MKKLQILFVLIFCFGRFAIAQDSPQEWAKHFKAVAETVEYAGVDAVTLSENGKVCLSLKISMPNLKKEEISQKAKLILKNFLEKYVDEYVYEDKLSKDGELMTSVTANSKFSTVLSSIYYHYKLKFEIGILATNGELTVILNNFYYSSTTEYGGRGGGKLDEYRPIVGITTEKNAVTKNHTKVMNNPIGWLRVGVIDLKKEIFNIFESKMKLSISELEKKEQW